MRDYHRRRRHVDIGGVHVYSTRYMYGRRHDGVDDGDYVGHVCVVHDGAVHVDAVHDDVVHVGGSSGSKSRKKTVFLF